MRVGTALYLTALIWELDNPYGKGRFMSLHPRAFFIFVVILAGCSTAQSRPRPSQPSVVRVSVQDTVPPEEGESGAVHAASDTAERDTGSRTTRRSTIEVDTPGVPAPEPDVLHFRINSVTLETGAQRRFGVDDDVRIVVTETNPFVHDYQIIVKNQPIAEASITDFFTGILNIPLPTVAPKEITFDSLTRVAAAAVGDTVDGPRVAVCSTLAESATGQIMVRLESINPLHANIRGRFEHLETLTGTTNQEMAERRSVFMHPQERASEVMRTASEAAVILQDYVDELNHHLGELTKEVPSYIANVAEVNRYASAALAEYKTCPYVVEAAAFAARFVPDTSVFRSGLAAVSAHATAMQDEPRKLGTVAYDPTRFYVTALLDRYTRPTDVTVQVARRRANTTDPYRDFTSQRLNFGGRARWSFSAGIVASGFAQRDFGTRATRIPAPTGNPGDTIANLIVETKGSNWSALPMVTFNTRFNRRPAEVNGQLVFGVATNDLKQPRLGFFLGLGADAFGQRLIWSVGALLAEETGLVEGLEVGDRVYNTSGFERTKMVPRLGFTLTYRVF